MSKNLSRVRARRAELVDKAARQRQSLVRSIEVWRRPLSLVDHGLAALRSVSKHPAWTLGSAFVPSALQPGRISTWLRRGALAFQLVRRLRAGRIEAE